MSKRSYPVWDYPSNTKQNLITPAKSPQERNRGVGIPQSQRAERRRCKTQHRRSGESFRKEGRTPGRTISRRRGAGRRAPVRSRGCAIPAQGSRRPARPER